MDKFRYMIAENEHFLPNHQLAIYSAAFSIGSSIPVIFQISMIAGSIIIVAVIIPLIIFHNAMKIVLLLDLQSMVFSIASIIIILIINPTTVSIILSSLSLLFAIIASIVTLHCIIQWFRSFTPIIP